MIDIKRIIEKKGAKPTLESIVSDSIGIPEDPYTVLVRLGHDDKDKRIPLLDLLIETIALGIIAERSGVDARGQINGALNTMQDILGYDWSTISDLEANIRKSVDKHLGAVKAK